MRISRRLLASAAVCVSATTRTVFQAGHRTQNPDGPWNLMTIDAYNSEGTFVLTVWPTGTSPSEQLSADHGGWYKGEKSDRNAVEYKGLFNWRGYLFNGWPTEYMKNESTSRIWFDTIGLWLEEDSSGPRFVEANTTIHESAGFSHRFINVTSFRSSDGLEDPTGILGLEQASRTTLMNIGRRSDSLRRFSSSSLRTRRSQPTRGSCIWAIVQLSSQAH
ncbi:hypothetical protein K456DRAFT_1935740 [Colletotrichum gloeosporioides 23]|nr:hypothetical protein K456DRAFT_1935740 [Colletotrichum gloeosporioides 23]